VPPRRVGALSDSSLLRRRLATLRLLIVVHPDAASELDTPQDLEQFPLVSVLGVPSVVSGTWSGAPFSVRPTPITRVATFSSALRMVEAGAGCARSRRPGRIRGTPSIGRGRRKPARTALDP